jgi:hypothetical protein
MRSAILLKQYRSKNVVTSEVNPNERVKCSNENICLVIKFEDIKIFSSYSKRFYHRITSHSSKESTNPNKVLPWVPQYPA